MPARGAICYLQLPTRDLRASIDFYTAAFGWQSEEEHGSFTAPGLIGQWSTELAPAAEGGPVLRLWVEGLYTTLTEVVGHGGPVRARPQPDQGERWLVEVDDPSGNRIGIVARSPPGSRSRC